MIKDADRLYTEIIRHHFMQKNIKSFIRQLNLYDFKKRNRAPSSISCYENKYFRQGREDLLPFIVRQTNNQHPKRDAQKEEKKEKPSCNKAHTYMIKLPFNSRSWGSHSNASGEVRKCALTGQKTTFTQRFGSQEDRREISTHLKMSSIVRLPLANDGTRLSSCARNGWQYRGICDIISKEDQDDGRLVPQIQPTTLH